MKRLLTRLLRPRRRSGASLDGERQAGTMIVDDRVLQLESEVRTLALELGESQQQVAKLQLDSARVERRAATQVDELVAAKVDRLLADAAGPATQIQTQARLLTQGVEVQARDVVAVASRLVSVLEQAGLHLEGVAGERVAYDPDHHAPLGSGAEPAPGESVVIRIPGAVVGDRLIRKAMVELARD